MLYFLPLYLLFTFSAALTAAGVELPPPPLSELLHKALILEMGFPETLCLGGHRLTGFVKN